ncbi:hypothetical protein O3P69_005205 [Scylla paramamosain]|uniref:Uncharacterized protein n=1 Tax=Scylla paramamosain TaxID=85552 RepID=A0AAW0UAE9_SCYPA
MTITIPPLPLSEEYTHKVNRVGGVSGRWEYRALASTDTGRQCGGPWQRKLENVGRKWKVVRMSQVRTMLVVRTDTLQGIMKTANQRKSFHQKEVLHHHQKGVESSAGPAEVERLLTLIQRSHHVTATL